MTRHARFTRWAVIATLSLFGCNRELGERAGADEDGDEIETGQAPDPTIMPPQIVQWDVSRPLREMTAKLPEDGPLIMRRHEWGRMRRAPIPDFVDAVQQHETIVDALPTASSDFEGIGQGFSGPAGAFTVRYIPPDTNGDVGPNHYVQTVNVAFAVFQKNGTPVYGPAAISSLFQGFGGPCETSDDGDPVVKYDALADRWVISQFALPGPPDYQCVAVSTTPDPMGTWNRFQFQFNQMNDYPKMAVWPDGYYFSVNLFGSGNSDIGGICAFDRATMLAGGMATSQCFTDNGHDTMLPADLVGRNMPAAGEPEFVMAIDNNALAFWKLHIDWQTPSNSHLTGPTSISVSSFSQADSPQQPDGVSIDNLSDRLMYRLNYRKFADHESLLVDHSVTAGNNIGMRWYEIRDPNGTPTVYQQGTYAPDSKSRWNGSINMDGAGNIAMGFSITDTQSTYPSVAWAGRLATDPMGMLAQGESIIHTGMGAQSSGSRWGDYSSMSVDPADDCTFWYTTEYIASTGTRNWHTRISSFKFPNCMGAGGTGGAGGSGGSGGTGGTGGSGGTGGDMIPPTIAITNPQDQATVPRSFGIDAMAMDNSGMIQKVEFLADGMSLGVITAPPWTFTVPAGRLPDGAHVLAAKATDPSNNTATSPVVHVTVANVNGSGGSGGQAGSGGSGGSGGQMGGNSGVEGGCACDVGGGHATGSWALFGLGVLIVTGSRRRIGRRRAR